MGVPGWPLVLQADIPTEPDLQAAADAVRAQADAVRALKTQQGLGNKVGRAREGCRLLGLGCVTGVGWLQGHVWTGFLTKARKKAETGGGVNTFFSTHPSCASVCDLLSTLSAVHPPLSAWCARRTLPWLQQWHSCKP